LKFQREFKETYTLRLTRMGIDITVSRTDDKYSTIYTNLKENERLLDRLLITTGK